MPHKVDSALYSLDGGTEMRSSLTAKVTLGLAEMPGHLPPSRCMAMPPKGWWPNTGDKHLQSPMLEAEYGWTFVFLPIQCFNAGALYGWFKQQDLTSLSHSRMNFFSPGNFSSNPYDVVTFSLCGQHRCDVSCVCLCLNIESPSLAVACGASVWNSGTVSVLCREHLWVVVDLKRCARNSLNEWMNEHLLWFL